MRELDVTKLVSNKRKLSTLNNKHTNLINVTTENGHFYFCALLYTIWNIIVILGEVDIDNDMNVEIEFDSNVDGYRLIYGENVRLMYAE